MKGISINMKGYIFNDDWRLCTKCVFFDPAKPKHEYCEIRNMKESFKRKNPETTLRKDMQSILDKCGNSWNGIFEKELHERKSFKFDGKDN